MLKNLRPRLGVDIWILVTNTTINSLLIVVTTLVMYRFTAWHATLINMATSIGAV